MNAKVKSIIEFKTRILRASITKAAATTAYSSGDVVANAADDNGFVFPGAADIGGTRSGSIEFMTIRSSANQASKMIGELWLFDQPQASLVADNGVFNPSDADLDNLIGIISFADTDWKVGGSTSGVNGNAVAQIRTDGIPYFLRGTVS